MELQFEAASVVLGAVHGGPAVAKYKLGLAEGFQAILLDKLVSQAPKFCITVFGNIMSPQMSIFMFSRLHVLNHSIFEKASHPLVEGQALGTVPI